MNNIDGYQVFAELKSGPATTIFKALDSRQNRVVLVKMLNAETATKEPWRAQFLQEGRISLALAHPNLRRTLHTGVHEEQPFLVLEYVEGPTLYELIKQHQKIPFDLCLYLAKELARAIAAVHQNHLLHHDIKPQNIFLSFNGTVKLGDLGLAREFAEAAPLMSGTPAYMSPEQILGRPLSPASDLFSFGAVFYEMLTGEVSFGDRTVAATLLHVANWDPVPITKLRPDTPPALIAICNKLLAKNPAERYSHTEAVLDELVRLERKLGWSTNKYHLAEFIESPETYRHVEVRPEAADLPPAPRKSFWRAAIPHAGVLAVMSATMFFAGVLFIRGVKEYVEGREPMARHAAMHAVLAAQREGYLALQVKPWGIVVVDGDTLGRTPLYEPLPLRAGAHWLHVAHPVLGMQEMEIRISAGDTFRQTIDLTKP